MRFLEGFVTGFEHTPDLVFLRDHIKDSNAFNSPQVVPLNAVPC